MIGTIPTSVIAEEDSERGGYCIECFSAAKNSKGKLYFFNGEGPFDSKNCYAAYIDVEPGKLPKAEWKGSIRDV